ncbi:MAG: tRNA (N(6)-L-threonylcarbamoyladenosine(37)-C(2))-methylthiotransferase [Candidatus Micrarchaeaceae archaeon]
MAKILIETYGCTLNQADSEMMERILAQAGHTVKTGRYDPNDQYDYVIMNTCTVKNPTEQRILDRLETMKGLGGTLIVTGCMASANPDKILSRSPGSSIVTTSNVHRIAEAISEASFERRIAYEGYSRTDKLSYYSPGSSAIAKIAISEGCLSNCSFCETKFARGPLNSFSEELILKAIEASVKKGAREIELTSQDAGAYGLDRKTNIAELALKAVGIDGDFKIRIGMLNPEHLPKYIDEMVEAYKTGKLYKFIHLPVQSGSDSILKKMGRKYTVDEFMSLASELKSKVTDISIATDIIVGFPGETEEDFTQSLQLVRLLAPSRINVSKFGARPHARASRLPQLRNEIIKERSLRMYRLARSAEIRFLTNAVGSRRKVLLTERNGESVLGRDPSYRQVAVHGSGCGPGESIEALIYGNTSACLLAHPAFAEILNK